jgi:hypothetical protein
MARVPFSEFESMSLTWETLGYEEMTFLTKTDLGWMREAWGEPPIHTTANLKYHDVWGRYENILIEEDQSRWQELSQLLRH